MWEKSLISLSNFKKKLTMRLPLNYIFVFLIFILISCSKDDVENQGYLQINFSSVQNDNGRVTQDFEATSKVIISIKDELGEFIIEDQSYDVIFFEGRYLIEPILLSFGDYSIDKFLVLNSNNEVVYATPKEGSLLESLVAKPLPIDFEIIGDQTTDIEIEVIETNGLEPIDLGYGSLFYKIVPTIDILVAVFGIGNNGYEFVSSELTISTDIDSLMTISLGDSINILKIRSDIDSYNFKFTYDTLLKEVDFSIDSINMFRTMPMEIFFTPRFNLDSGLVVYYPFNGNADDEGGSGYDGVVTGASLTSDRFGNTNSAYYFDGNDDYISLGNDFDLNELTINFWFKPDLSFVPSPQTILVSDHLSKLNGLWNFSFWDNSEGYQLRYNRNGVTHFVNADEQFHMATMVYSNSKFYFYLDGILVFDGNDDGNIQSSFSPTGSIVGSSRGIKNFFHGKIDDISFFDRKLSNNEVMSLFINL